MAVAMAARAAVSTSAWARSPICSRTGSTSAKSPIGVVHRGEHEPILTRDLYAAEVQSVLRPEIRSHVLCKPGRNNNRCLPPDIGLSAIAWPTAIRSTVFPWSGLLELVRDLIHYDYRDMISAMTT